MKLGNICAPRHASSVLIQNMPCASPVPFEKKPTDTATRVSLEARATASTLQLGFEDGYLFTAHLSKIACPPATTRVERATHLSVEPDAILPSLGLSQANQTLPN